MSIGFMRYLYSQMVITTTCRMMKIIFVTAQTEVFGSIIGELISPVATALILVDEGQQRTRV